MKISEQEWDFIVIGTGPSGATVAKELAKQNHRVLILEKGHPDISINIPSMLKNKEMLFIGNGRTLVRGIRTGGTSVLYYGTAYEPPKNVFEPFGIDLSNELVELRKELPIQPLKNELLGPGAKRIMDSALELGYRWGKLDKFIYQNLCTPNEFPFEAQWNSLRFLDEAVKNGAKLLVGADVKKITSDGNKAVAVEAVIEGEHRSLRAGNIVLAAGGLASAQILRASGIGSAGEGFFCDPLTIVQGVVNESNLGNEIPMAAGMVFEQEGYVLTDLTVPKIVHQLFSLQALHPERVLLHNKTLAIMVKVRDEIGGRISQSGKIQKTFSEADKAKMRDGVSQAKRILENAGAQKIFNTTWTSAHPGGSARIGLAVDANLETEIRNLYVSDCSVIPAAWGLPPTLTLLALAKRLAKHLTKA